MKSPIKQRRRGRIGRRSGCRAELLEPRRLLAAPGIDLIPSAPPGWSDKIVVSTASGTSTDGAVFTSADKLYIDTAVSNAGDTATAADYSNRLSVDGVQAYTWNAASPQPAGSFVSNLDAVIGPLTAGAHTLTLEADYANAIDEADETNNLYSRNINVASVPADLTPYQPDGWTNKIILTTLEGNFTDASTFTTFGSLFVHAAMINQGGEPTTVPFATQTFIDGVKLHTFSTAPPVGVGGVVTFDDQDIALRNFTLGTHTISIIVDYGNAVAERDETNNYFSRTFQVLGNGYADFTPNEPQGWPDKIVVSTVPGTSTDATQITTNDTIYVDYSSLNQGAAFNSRSYTRVLLDGVQFHNFFVNSHAANFYYYWMDAPHAPLSAGVHTITVECDFTNAISYESDETNNTYSRSITVIAPEALPTVASISASPNPVTSGGALTLTAAGVADADGTVASVSFYLESNGTPGLQADGADVLLDSDAQSADGWIGLATTYGLAPGDYTVYARAMDDQGGAGAPASTTFTILPLPTGSISGLAFHDLDGDGKRSAGEPVLPGWTVFLDTNNNNLLDSGEASAVSDAQGAYTFSNLPAGRYTVAQLPPDGWSRTSPASTPAPVWVEKGPASIASGFNGNLPPNGLVSGRINAIAPDPTDPLTCYIGAAGGGVWKSSDAGASWTPLTDQQASLPIGALAVAPSAPNVIYAGTGDGIDFSGKGILKSTDGGKTWTLLGSDVFARRAFWRIVVDPLDPNIVYAGARGAGDGVAGNRGVWKTTDGGVTWSNTFASISDTASVTDLLIDPSDSQILYAALGNSAGNVFNGVYKTTNGGGTWTLLDNVPFGIVTGTIRLAISSDGQILYAAVTNPVNNRLRGFFQSTDRGASWVNRTLGTPEYLAGQGWFATVLAVDPIDPLRVYAAGTGRNWTDSIIRSDDGGATWRNIGNWKTSGQTLTTGWPHVDHHALAFDADGRLLDGNDGGIWRTADQGIDWVNMNANLDITEFVGISGDPSNRDLIYGGSQDNGTEKSSGAAIWDQVAAGDGGFVRVDPGNPATVYHTYFYAKGQTNFFRRSDDAGATWLVKTTGINTSTGIGVFYPPLVIDPSNPSRLLLGLDRLYESTDKANSWSAISPALVAGKAITALAVAPGAPDTLYVTYDDGSVWRTTDHGANWVNVTPGLAPAAPPDTPPTGVQLDDDQDEDEGGIDPDDSSGPGNGAILADPTDPLTVYLVRNGYGGGHVFLTTNGGASWSDISGDLPDLPTNAIAIDPRTTVHTLYVGTVAGVYFSTDAGVHWNRFGAGLPNADVTDLQLSLSENFITAGTFGRGAWQIALTGASVGAIGVTLSPGQDAQLAAFGAQHYPTVADSQFDFSTSSHRLKFTFSKAMSASLSLGMFDVRALASGLPIVPSSLAYDPTSRTATLAFDSPLLDGRYRLTALGSMITDAFGNALDGNADGNAGDDFTFDFFFLAADANHDGAVNFSDLVAVAQNYNGTGKSYSQGDFNYDAKVDFTDLVMLAQRYNTSLPPVGAAAVVAVSPAAGAIKIARSGTASKLTSRTARISKTAKPGLITRPTFSTLGIVPKAGTRRRKWAFD